MLALVLAVLCLGLNAFFVAAEFALVKVHVTKIEPRARRGERRAVAAKKVLARLDRYLSVTQFGITVASLGLGWIGEPSIEALGHYLSLRISGAPLGPTGLFLVDAAGLGLLTFLHLLLGELVPKFVAIQHSEKTVLRAALPLRFVDAAFRPVLWVLEKSQRVVLRLLGIDPEVANEGTLSEEEIIGLLAANAARGEAARDKQRIVERVLRMSRHPVRTTMVPRVDVVALPIDTPGERAYAMLLQYEFSRVLVYRDSIDSIAGYLYVKDFLFDASARQRPSLHGLERRALFVLESSDGLAALRAMQRERIPFAVVVDEYGGTSGIVTLEDLVEDVFGDIRDELDQEPEKVVCLNAEASMWDVAANATTLELREAGVPVDPSLPDQPIGKLVVERLGRLPRVGDVVAVAEGVIGRVTATSRRRVDRVRLQIVGSGPFPGLSLRRAENL